LASLSGITFTAVVIISISIVVVTRSRLLRGLLLLLLLSCSSRLLLGSGLGGRWDSGRLHNSLIESVIVVLANLLEQKVSGKFLVLVTSEVGLGSTVLTES
jgi:hypothetical protein